MTSKGISYLAVAMALASLAFSGCSQTDAPIKIGHASPLSGNQAETGIDQKRGAELAVAELKTTLAAVFFQQCQ